MLNPPTKISRANIHTPIARIRNMTIPIVPGIDTFRLAWRSPGIMPPTSLFVQPTRCGLIRFYRRIYGIAPIALCERRGFGLTESGYSMR